MDAALELLSREGVGALTLERVAREAGVSKGGLLYHYAGKEELLAALIQRVIDVLEPSSPGAGAASYIKAGTERGCDVAAVLMAAAASSPQLLGPVRERYRKLQEAFEHDGRDPVRGTVARLAAEGLWFSEALGLAPPPPQARKLVLQEILSLLGPGVAMPQQSGDALPAPPADARPAPASSPGELHELAGGVRASLQLGAQALWNLQNPDGHWRGDLAADTTLESDYVLLSLWLNQPEAGAWNPPDRARISKALATILDRQLPDGGWNIYPGGPSEVNATARAYIALKLGGYDPDHPALGRARSRALDLGGLQATNSYTKINLSLFGLFPRQFTPSVPPEVMLLPGNLLYEMSSWSRAIVVPLSIVQASGQQRRTPGGITVDELFVPGKKLVQERRDRLSGVFIQADKFLKLWERRGLKDIRARAIRQAEKWMLEHMRFSDGLGAIYPSMMYAIMAMDALGYERDQPDFADAVRQFDKLVLETADRLEFQPSLSPVWDTAIAMFALGESGAAQPGAMRKAADWLLDREVRRKGDWSVKRPDLHPGGWAFEYANDFYPDIDDTAMVLLALQHAQASDPERQARAESRAIQWLLGMQSSDGGWAAFDVDNNWEMLTKVPFADHNAMLDPSCPDITGRVLESLCRRGLTTDHPAMSRAVQYLIHHQRDDGSWFGRWGVNYTYGTFLAMRGLRASKSAAAQPAIQRGAAWLRSVQNPDGGWGESCAGYELHRFVASPSTPSQTAWALLGLEAAGDTASQEVGQGVKWLLRNQNPAGGWDEQPMTGTGFPNVFYLSYRLYAHYFPLLALAAWRKSSEPRA